MSDKYTGIHNGTDDLTETVSTLAGSGSHKRMRMDQAEIDQMLTARIRRERQTISHKIARRLRDISSSDSLQEIRNNIGELINELNS